MTIDVDKCTGCKSCIIACHAENNVAVVGAEQSAMGRILHWLRIERIHHGTYPHVHADFIPMLCQQCGAAPCESVCPVFAAVHTHDGLNGQIYNRCIGTRVCANNCPYHVRMFNFVTPTWPEPMHKMLNPDVCVRSEGVMEKCTFCVQRIRRGNIDAKVEKRTVLDGEIRPACVQSCASEALVFGLLSDPESTVSKTLERNRYRSVLLHNEHDTRPNVIYLRPDRNPDVLEPADLSVGERRPSEAQGSPAPEATATPEASPAPVSSVAPGATASPSAPAATASPAVNSATATPQPVGTP
jgi:molybdopterin-containing oxidoreductase family iron-sulfur binding subunit